MFAAVVKIVEHTMSAQCNLQQFREFFIDPVSHMLPVVLSLQLHAAVLLANGGGLHTTEQVSCAHAPF